MFCNRFVLVIVNKRKKSTTTTTIKNKEAINIKKIN